MDRLIVSDNSAGWLKLFAIVGMVAEHSSRLGPPLGAHLVNWSVAWVWPVFSMLLAVNLVGRTRDPEAYAWRVTLLGLVSQVPFGIYFGHLLNPNPVLCMGLGMWAFILVNRLQLPESPRLGKLAYAIYPGHLVLLIVAREFAL